MTNESAIVARVGAEPVKGLTVATSASRLDQDDRIGFDASFNHGRFGLSGETTFAIRDGAEDPLALHATAAYNVVRGGDILFRYQRVDIPGTDADDEFGFGINVIPNRAIKLQGNVLVNEHGDHRILAQAQLGF